VSDLSECLGHLVEGATLADFQLGKNDVAQGFRLPQAIYGRAAEREALFAALARASRGAAELVIVSGPSGSGKTALIHELRAPCAREQVRFAAGSGDPVRVTPYGVLSQALGDLCDEILAEGEERAAALRERLREAVGAGLDVVVDVIPSLGRLVLPLHPPTPPPHGHDA